MTMVPVSELVLGCRLRYHLVNVKQDAAPVSRPMYRLVSVMLREFEH